MRKIVSCEFNMDTACVELRLEDGTLLSIDCTAIENEVVSTPDGKKSKTPDRK